MDSVHTRFRCILAVLFILLFVTSASAEGLFGGALPLFGGLSRGTSACAPTKSVCGPLTFYAGWGGDRKGSTLSFDLRSPGTDDLVSIINTYPVRGLWLGLAAQANLTERAGLLADYWILVPSNEPSDESYTIAAAPPGSKTWNSTKTDWWFIDGALSYDTGGLGKVLAGFRYDHFATNFENPGDFVGALGLSSDRGDVTVNCYLPFIGIQTDQGSPGGRQLMFRVIGFPLMAGDVKYHDSIGSFGGIVQDRIELSKGFGKGYFLEAFAQYAQPVFGSGQIGVFGRWSMLHGDSGQIAITDVLGGFPLTGKYQFVFERQSWTLGGSFIFDFNLPLGFLGT